MKKIVAFLFVAALSLGLVACNDKALTTEEKEEQLVAAFVAYMGSREGKATIKGNDGIISVSSSDKAWDDIKKDHPIVEEDNSDVTIKFGGSTSVEKIAKALSTQFAPLAGNFKASHVHTGSGDAYKRTQGGEKDTANALHIGFASRAFSSEETTGPAATRGQLAIDAVVAIVPAASTETSITRAQLKALFEAANENYKVYTRDASSGTREAFLEAIGLKKTQTETEAPVGASQVSSNGDMLNKVGADSKGIGYASLASLASNKTIKGLKFAGEGQTEAVEATEATVLSGDYKMQRPFMFITRNYTK